MCACVCLRLHRVHGFMCVCAAMSDRWCAYVVMSHTALWPFSPDSLRGFQMAALFPKSSSLWFLILILSSRLVSAAGVMHPGRNGEMSGLHRSLAADLFISLCPICLCHTCVIAVYVYFQALTDLQKLSWTWGYFFSSEQSLCLLLSWRFDLIEYLLNYIWYWYWWWSCENCRWDYWMLFYSYLISYELLNEV